MWEGVERDQLMWAAPKFCLPKWDPGFGEGDVKRCH